MKQKMVAKAMSGQAAQTVIHKAIDGFEALRPRLNHVTEKRIVFGSVLIKMETPLCPHLAAVSRTLLGHSAILHPRRRS